MPGWVKIKKIIPPKIKFLGMEKDFKILKLKKDWDNLLGQWLGEKFKQKAKIIKNDKKTLFVSCRNAVWANEFYLKQKTILSQLKKNGWEIEMIKFSF